MAIITEYMKYIVMQLWRGIITSSFQVMLLLKLAWFLFVNYIVWPIWNILKCVGTVLYRWMYNMYLQFSQIVYAIYITSSQFIYNKYCEIYTVIARIIDAYKITLHNIYIIIENQIKQVYISITDTLSKIYKSITDTSNDIYNNLTNLFYKQENQQKPLSQEFQDKTTKVD